MTRKEYIDTLTAYGTAEYIAKAMRTFSNKTYNTLLDKDFWNEWLTGKVDSQTEDHGKNKGALKFT